MNTIMTIAYNANRIAALGRTSEDVTANEPKIRMMQGSDDTEQNLLEGVQQKMEVVHPVHHTTIYLNAEEIISAQKRIEDAVRLYEDRIYKRPPLDIA